MKNNKSAKDIAFDKERAKFRSEIRKLTDNLKNQQNQINELNEIIREKDNEILQQKEWINRLLEYTELSKEDLKELIDNEKTKHQAQESISTTLGALGIFRSFGEKQII